MISLRTGTTQARVALKGAELTDWSVKGRPLLWQADPRVWDETAPILFPVVGWTKNHQVRVDGTVYPLALHGFARHREFRILEQSDDRALLGLVSDAATRAVYPFDFRLTVEYRLGEGTVSATLGIENLGTMAMPYACGIHPGFRWPFDGGAAEGYLVRFAAPESPVVPRIAPGGLISEHTRRLPLEGQVLRLAPQLFEDDALCFINAASTSLRFEAPNGAAIIVETEAFPHLGLWCRPGNGYLCIEEWSGYGDPENFAGDLFAKPSMLILQPGDRQNHTARFTYEDQNLPQ